MSQNSDVQLGRIEVQLESLNDKLFSHTNQDMTQFNALFAQLNTLDTKMDAMLLREAQKEGEKLAIRRVSGYVSAIVSLIVTSIVASIMKIFGV